MVTAMANQRDTAPLDKGLFDPPLFEDASAKSLSRVGVIDVGSNSVRMVVFDGAARSPAYFFNEKIMCALGAGLPETGYLNPTGRQRAVAAMQRFAALARGMQVRHLTAVATAAVRDAADGPAFVKEVESQTGLNIWVIDGQEEARLSAQGVLLGWPGAYGLVCDIGGSSLELAEIGQGRVGKRVTSDLGPLKLQAVAGGRAGRKAHITQTLARLQGVLGPQPDRLFLVGGSWRAIARIDMHRRGYPLRVLHEYQMTSADARATVKRIEGADLDDLRQTCGISGGRMALVPLAAEVLRRLIQTFRPHDIAISSYGLREGLLYEQMPQRLRNRDPLIEACRFAEQKDARLPGFGKRLFAFIQPLFRQTNEAEQRIIKAACLLHDVNWRAHPNYRGQVCFDAVTRASLGGLNHRERIFLGLSLLYRYRNGGAGGRMDDLVQLLSAREAKRAEVLGKAMRLGAMLWTQDGDIPMRLRLAPRRRELELSLTTQAAPLFGEVAEARFKSLAHALNATPTLRQCRAK